MKVSLVWPLVVAVAVASAGAAAGGPVPADASACDGKAVPCPLQKWMRDSAKTPLDATEWATLAKNMTQAGTFGGPDMKDWSTLAKKTSTDAAAGKAAEVQADCKACHDTYRDAYKKDPALRNKPVP